MLDQELSGEANEVIKKVNARLRFMYRQGYFLTSSMRKTLCNSLIQCHFDYACSSWYSTLSKYFQKRLQVTQNKVVRFVSKYNPRRSVRSSDLSKLWNTESSKWDWIMCIGYIIIAVQNTWETILYKFLKCIVIAQGIVDTILMFL